MINKLYGLLAPNAVANELYYRKSDQARYILPELDVLKPKSSEPAYVQFCADQLCRIVSASQYKDILLELDPNNTYQYPVSKVTNESTEIAGIPEDVGISVVDVNAEKAWIEKTIEIFFDGVTTVTFDGSKSVEWGAAGTESVVIDGIAIALNNPAPVSGFTATVSLIRKPARNIFTVLSKLDEFPSLAWSDALRPYKDVTAPSSRLAIYILNALSKVKG